MTTLGILSDSHGRGAITERAARLLVGRGAQALVHLGDVGSEDVLDALLQGPPVRIVFGNCDMGTAAMARYALDLGIGVDDPMGYLKLDGKLIAYTHGHLPHLLMDALDEGVDYLLHGHTHVQRDERHGRTRIINPGALFRAGVHTVALLDTAEDRLEFIEIAATPPAASRV